ncbi:hypothetical protein BASA81_005486 [Batrachochytrium salamandrivorans]|nr:hypothetical protein BASA81_005486 [Batrachochytrium salamandrivorans]
MINVKRLCSAYSYQTLDRHPNLRHLVEERELSSHEKMALGGFIDIGLKNLAHNRYGNVIPFDHSLAKCSLGYCNASLVDFSSTLPAYVICQGPMSPEYYGVETRDRFWCTALENNVRIMVGLAQFEPGFLGCSKYVGDEFYGDYLVNVVEQEEEQGGAIIKRLLHVQHRNDVEPTEIIHFQFDAWPNYSICDSNDALAKLIVRVDECWRNGKRGRIMVNCGTFVAIHQTVLQAQDKVEDSLDKLAFQQAVHLRQARHPWMVEGEHQFKLITSIARSILGVL